MLEFWKRQEARLAMHWGMSEFEAVRMLQPGGTRADLLAFCFCLKTRIECTRMSPQTQRGEIQYTTLSVLLWCLLFLRSDDGEDGVHDYRDRCDDVSSSSLV